VRDWILVAVLLLVGHASSGCAIFKTYWTDMAVQLEEIPVPASYELLKEERRGVKPPIFAAVEPRIYRFYGSPDDAERTCGELAESLGRTPERLRQGLGCRFHFRVWTGWRAWIWGSLLWGPWRYGVGVFVAERGPSRDTPRYPPWIRTWVHVTLADGHPYYY